MSRPSGRRLWLVALMLVPLGFVVAGWIAVRPWVAPPGASPEDIARTWAQVEGWAREGRYASAPAEQLEAAVAELQRAKLPDERWDPRQPAAPVTDAAAQRAVAGLIAWSEQGGGLGDELCIADPAELVAQPGLFGMLQLARLAIGASQGGDDPGLAAALRLGAYLRSRGGMLAGAIGFSLARDAAEVAVARSYTPGPAFVTFAPRREEMLSVLAREAVCSMRMAEAVLARGEPAVGDEPIPANPGWLARQAVAWVGPDRELAMARWFLGERVAAAARAGDDVEAMAASQEVPDDPDALPASLLVRALAVNAASLIRDVDATLAAYAELVEAPPRV